MKKILILFSLFLVSCSSPSIYFINDVSDVLDGSEKRIPFTKDKVFLIKGIVGQSFSLLGESMLVLEDCKDSQLRVNIYSTNIYGKGEKVTLRIKKTIIRTYDSEELTVYREDFP